MLGREHVNGLYEFFMREHNGPNSTKFQKVTYLSIVVDERLEITLSQVWLLIRS